MTMPQTDTPSKLSGLKEELGKIRSLPRGKRFEYIWEYYRLTVFLVLFGCFFLWMIGSFLVNSVMNTFFPKDSFSIAFAASDFSSNENWMEDCLTAIGYDEKQEEFHLLTSTPFNDTTDDFRIAVSVWLVNGQPDIFIVDENSYQYLLEMKALAKLPETWSPELQKLAADRMTDPWRLDISDTALAEACGLTSEPVYLCMYLHGNGVDRALDMVKYILTE